MTVAAQRSSYDLLNDCNVSLKQARLFLMYIEFLRYNKLIRYRAQFILFMQVLAHISIFPMIYYADGRHYLISVILYFLTGTLGMSMTYHRYLSHKSWPAPRWFQIFGSLLGVIGITGSPIAWVSIHRQHHRYTDKEGDPHSPWVHNTLWAQYLSMFFKPKIKYSKNLLKDRYQIFFHKQYELINISYALLLYFISPFALVYAYLFPAMLLWNVGSAINTIGHLYGYQNFQTGDKSKNNLVLGWLAWGEGWHNNHHHDTRAFCFQKKWWEFDLSGFLIKIFFTDNTDRNINSKNTENV